MTSIWGRDATRENFNVKDRTIRTTALRNSRRLFAFPKFPFSERSCGTSEMDSLSYYVWYVPIKVHLDYAIL